MDSGSIIRTPTTETTETHQSSFESNKQPLNETTAVIDTLKCFESSDPSAALLQSALQTPKTPRTDNNQSVAQRLNGEQSALTANSSRSSVLCDSSVSAVRAVVVASAPVTSSSSNSCPTMPRQQANGLDAVAATNVSTDIAATIAPNIGAAIVPALRQCNSDNVLGGADEAPLEPETKVSSTSKTTAAAEFRPLLPDSSGDFIVLSSCDGNPTTSTPIIGSCAAHSNSNTSSTDQTSNSSASLSTTNTTNTTATTADIAIVVAIAPTQSTPNLLQCLSSSGGKTLNDTDTDANIKDGGDGGDDENSDRKEDDSVEHIRPLLSATVSIKKPTRSIVKSPSNRSFNVGGPDEGKHGIAVEAPRHVKFHHQNGGIAGSDSRLGDSAPASSVGSTSSSSASCSSSSSSDDEGSSSGAYSEAQPPDGGWGWVVVFASFIINLIADGITFSFGVIYVEFLAYFGEGKGKTAWIGSLFMAMPLLSGPIASFLTDRYGCRKVTIVGSLLASLGFILSAFSTSMEMLFITFGILAGFGLSLCYVAAVVIVAYYFDKRRSFATGLSVCGSGIGTFIFAPLTQVLIETYGWRGTTLILAGFFLNMTVCGMLMRDLEWTTHRAKLKAKQRKQHKRLGISADSFSVSNSTNTGGTASNAQQQHEPRQPTVQELYDRAMDPATNPRLFSSLITLPTYLRNGERVSDILGFWFYEWTADDFIVFLIYNTDSSRGSRTVRRPS